MHDAAITSLGDDLTYDLVKPVLERCDADQLLRLEHTSPVCQLDILIICILIPISISICKMTRQVHLNPIPELSV
jgi:hypothetical protein